MRVPVINNNISRAINRLEKKLHADGLYKELQNRRYYTKPSDKKRLKRKLAISRERKEALIRENNLF